MKSRTSILLFTLLLFCVSTFAQSRVTFADIDVRAATQRANIENKNIFVDAYAPWCGPCKIVDRYFNDPEIARYFSKNFINIKINTDTGYGKEVSRKYGITFLPAILILDKDGKTRYKVDKLMSRDELLSLAKYAIEGPTYPTPTAPTASTPVSKPSPRPAQKKEAAEVRIEPKKPEPSKAIVGTPKKPAPEPGDDGEKILYVLDANATDLPPEILYEEAYFRMQLNDGSHKEAAAKYLATQENWLSEKNAKFIFDFLYDTDSEEFKFFLANKEEFENHIGLEKIDQSLKILIANKLYQGIPRPTFEQSQYLLSLIGPDNYEKNNYHYFLTRLLEEDNHDEFMSLAEVYVKKYVVVNQEITVEFISNKLETTTQKNKLKSLVGLFNKLETPEENYNYLVCAAKLYLSISDKENAISYANKAISFANENKTDSSKAKQILETIKAL